MMFIYKTANFQGIRLINKNNTFSKNNIICKQVKILINFNQIYKKKMEIDINKTAISPSILTVKAYSLPDWHNFSVQIGG